MGGPRKILIRLKEFVEANNEPKSFAINDREELVWT